MRKIKVLMVGSKLTVKGGMTTVVESFLENQYMENIEIKYIPTHIEKNRILQMIYFFISIIRITKTLLLEKIDIMHIHVSEKGSFYRKNIILKIAKKFKVKTIVHMHGAEFKEFYRDSSSEIKKKIVEFLKNADTVIVLGSDWQEFVKSLDEKIKTQIYRNAVEQKEFVPNFKDEEINILFLAVLIKRKGIFDLIQCAKNLNGKNNRKIKFLIAGTGQEEEKAKELVKEYKLEEKFEFLGWVTGSQKEKLLKKSQIFILPSYNEGLPVAILEAMSYGLPIISTKVGSVEDAVLDGKNGFVVSPGNIQEMVKKLNELLTDINLRKNFSKESKKMIRDDYNSEKYFMEINKLYVHLIN